MLLLKSAINTAIIDRLNALQLGSANTLWEQPAAFVRIEGITALPHGGVDYDCELVVMINGTVELLFANNVDHTPLIASIADDPLLFDSGDEALRWRGRLQLAALRDEYADQQTSLVITCALDGRLTRPFATVPVPTEPTVRETHTAEALS